MTRVQCSGAGQSFEMHLKGCHSSSRAELTQFSVQLREVWLYQMDWDLLGPKAAQLSPSNKPVYMHGAVCATRKHMLLLFIWTLFKKLLSIPSYAILPVSQCQ